MLFVSMQKDIPINSLKEYDLVCVGAPTEGFTASKSIKEFLGRLKGIDLAGKYRFAFAFDTKLDSRF
jgi:flavodoxin